MVRACYTIVVTPCLNAIPFKTAAQEGMAVPVWTLPLVSSKVITSLR